MAETIGSLADKLSIIQLKIYHMREQLARMDGERSLRPNDKIGAGDFLFDWHLGGDALLDLFRRPAACAEPFVLRGGRAGNANNLVKMGFGARFKQQRNDDDGKRAVFLAPAIASAFV